MARIKEMDSTETITVIGGLIVSLIANIIQAIRARRASRNR